jgi:hypothetical protein
MNGTGVVVWTFFALVVVAVVAYRVGYMRGQAELLRQWQPTEAELNALRMKSVLPRWRRGAGWAVYVFSGLLLCVFLALAYRYAKGWGWTSLMAAWVLWFAIFMGGLWLAEWCWKPYREAQERRWHEEAEVRKALEARASKEDAG